MYKLWYFKEWNNCFYTHQLQVFFYITSAQGYAPDWNASFLFFLNVLSFNKWWSFGNADESKNLLAVLHTLFYTSNLTSTHKGNSVKLVFTVFHFSVALHQSRDHKHVAQFQMRFTSFAVSYPWTIWVLLSCFNKLSAVVQCEDTMTQSCSLNIGHDLYALILDPST